MTQYKHINLGRRIAELRHSLGITQDELSKRAHVSRAAVTQWESGNTKNIKNDNLFNLARAFSMSIDELLTGKPFNYCVAEYNGEEVAGTLSVEEEILLEKYRTLNAEDRTRLRKILTAFNATDDAEKVSGNGG